MAELSSSSVRKLEPFLLMAKSAKGAGAAKLIQDATSAPGVFVFAELLEMANVQEVRNPHQSISNADVTDGYLALFVLSGAPACGDYVPWGSWQTIRNRRHPWSYSNSSLTGHMKSIKVCACRKRPTNLDT